MLKKLHLFILKSFTRIFLLSFFVAMFILMMNFIKRFAVDLIGKGLDTSVILEVLLYGAAGMVSMGLPLAILIASIMTMGDLGEHFELTALKSTGISLYKILRPLMVFISIIAVLMFFYSNHTATYSTMKLKGLVNDINRKSPEISLKTGLFNNDIEGFTLRFKKRNNETGMLYNFMIYDHSSEKGNISVTLADSADLKLSEDERYMILSLYNGRNYFEHVKENETAVRTSKHQQNSFDKQEVVYELNRMALERSNLDMYKNDSRIQNIKELNEYSDSLEQELATVSSNFLIKLMSISKQQKVSKEDVENLSDKEKAFLLNGNMARNEAEKELALAAKTEIANMQYEINKRAVEWHRKFLLAFTCIIFFLIGAPFGAIIRKGGVGVSIFVSIVFFVAFYILSIAGEKLVKEDVVPAIYGMWFSAMVLLPIGLFLTYKAANDSVLLNINTYTQWFKNIFSKK